MARDALHPDRLHSDVKLTLEAIDQSGVLGAQSRLSSLLHYIVSTELDGHGDRLKAYTIGTELFGRSSDFDPNTDSIVRVEMRRLRQSLEHFYNTLGNDGQIRITIPKGSYRPEFTILGVSPIDGSPEPQSRRTPRKLRGTQLRLAFGAVLISCILLFVILLKDRVPQPDFQTVRLAVLDVSSRTTQPLVTAAAQNLSRELTTLLSRNPVIEIVGSRDAPSSTAFGIDFRIETYAAKLGDANRHTVSLINNHTGAVVWSRGYTIGLQDPSHSLELAAHISSELQTRLLGATRELLEGRDPQTLSAHQLFMMATWVSGHAFSSLEWELERVKLARLAVEKNPDYGPAHSVLADKLAYLAAVDQTQDTPKALNEAKASWQRAMELSPLNSYVVFNAAQGQWHAGYIEESVKNMERVVQLDPSHPLAGFLALVYPFTCVRPSDEALNAAISFDHSLAPDDPIRWITLTWISRMNFFRGDLESALIAEAQAAQIFQSPYTVVRHAAILNQLGQRKAALQLIDDQKGNWPSIDPKHFAEVTIPRMCKDATSVEVSLSLYQRLAAALRER